MKSRTTGILRVMSDSVGDTGILGKRKYEFS